MNLLTEENKKSFIQRDTLINNSIHLGNKNLSNYKKGLDCIFDAFLLSDCNILYHSTGNFSMFCQLFNNNFEKLELHNFNNIL